MRPFAATTVWTRVASPSSTGKVNETLVPKLRTLPGFKGYYLIEAGDGVFSSLGLCRDPCSMARSRASSSTSWIQDEKLETLMPNEPEDHERQDHRSEPTSSRSRNSDASPCAGVGLHGRSARLSVQAAECRPARRQQSRRVLLTPRALRARASIRARARVDLRPPRPARLRPLVVAAPRPDLRAVDDPDVHDRLERRRGPWRHWIAVALGVVLDLFSYSSRQAQKMYRQRSAAF